MILVPIDGSADAAHALDYACDLGKLLGTDVHVCHAIDNAASDAPTDGDAVLAKARRIARNHEVSVHCHLLRGKPAASILRLASDTHADLVIMGTHGRTGFRRLVLGSVAEEVTRHSPVPVLLLRDPTYDLNTPTDPEPQRSAENVPRGLGSASIE
jgi:nucleotide-binding universal stress UspA family protein